MRLNAIYTGLLFALAAVHALPAVKIPCVSYVHISWPLYLTCMIKDVYIVADKRGVDAGMEKRTCVRLSSSMTSVLWLICLKADGREYLTMTVHIC